MKTNICNDHLQMIRHSSLSGLRRLILTASYVSVLTLKGLRSQASSQGHLFSSLLSSYGRGKSSFVQFYTNFTMQSPNIFMPNVLISSPCINETIHVVLIRDCNHDFVFSFYFIQVIIFADLLDAYNDSE